MLWKVQDHFTPPCHASPPKERGAGRGVKGTSCHYPLALNAPTSASKVSGSVEQQHLLDLYTKGKAKKSIFPPGGSHALDAPTSDPKQGKVGSPCLGLCSTVEAEKRAFLLPAGPSCLGCICECIQSKGTLPVVVLLLISATYELMN